MDLGQSLRGVDVGPSALRYAGLAQRLQHLGHHVEDRGNIEVAVRATLHAGVKGTAYIPAIRATCEQVYDAARQAIAQGCLPLFMGGDHSMAIGTIGGATHDQPAGVLWIDAEFPTRKSKSTASGRT